jgi:hypothetical protein
MKVKKGTIESQDLIFEIFKNPDHEDCYEIELQPNSQVNLRKCLEPIFEQPAWMDALYKLRDILVKPFGLETGDNMKVDYDALVGGKMSFFEILGKNDHEILLYGNDKHLEAWFSVVLGHTAVAQVVRFSTVVHYHNLLGRSYFTMIKPFHKLIIHYSLKRVFKNQ